MSALLQVEALQIEFVDRGTATNRPLRGISLSVAPGEILGLVGETGSGKTLTGLAVLGRLPRGARASGRIVVDGVEQDLSRPGTLGGDVISIVFQNPGTAFNPVFTLGRQMRDVLRRRRVPRESERSRILEMLGEVGLPDPERVMAAYPHELSGGMLQRAMIAMALLCEPKLLILDEPTTALDVTVAKQILDLVRRLRDRFGFGALLITHNLAVVHEACDSVAVLYAGRVVEHGQADAVLTEPAHPYSRGLLAALPAGREPGELLVAIPGSVPGNLLAISGCAFAARCPIAIDACTATDPPLMPAGEQHTAACIRIGVHA
ncbi:ABC transporter ATP-binding protein [Agrococcus sp. ProA11]|uniref:ABC transporter ATP-binding protein n=1 Tax=Agrococcus chionoecetis TaxID=3153752 RepID=UPI0032611765